MPTVFPPSPSNGDKWASGLVWTAPTFQKKLASELRNSTQFGLSNAISADGTTALIGAEGKYVDGIGTTGGVYAFNYSAGVWSESQIITASDLGDSDRFGASVAMSADGNTAVIGAYNEDTAVSNDGAAYIFTRSAGTWTQQAKLLASDPQGFSNFGFFVSISADGSTVVVGAPFADTGGAAYIYTGSGSTWTEQAKLLASDPASGDNFGRSASLSADGNTILVGAYLEDTSPNTSNGAAYVFTRSGTTWTEQQKLLALVRQGSAALGISVALSNDGNSAFLGAFQSSSSVSFSGSVYYFTRSGTTWTQQQQISASDAASSDNFGYSVAVSPDGSLLLVGAPSEDTSPNTNNGAVYSFRYSGSSWIQTNKYLASDAQSSDNFGGGEISISSNGSKFIIGCPSESTSPNTFNGAVYFYDSPTYDLSAKAIYTYNSTKNLWTLDNASPVKAPTTHVFTSSQTWSIPANAKMIHAWVIGAGGGGGGGCVTNGTDVIGGSGGSGGALSRVTHNIIPGYNDTTATITIGAGGPGGSGGPSTGGNGAAGASGSASTLNLVVSGSISAITANGGVGGAGGIQSSSTASDTAQTLGMHGGGSGRGGTTTRGGSGGATAAAAGDFSSRSVAFNISGGTSGQTTPNFVSQGGNGQSSSIYGPGGGGGGGLCMEQTDEITPQYGGNGGLYGGGGGGGGSVKSLGFAGGAGGAGAQGVVVLMVWYG